MRTLKWTYMVGLVEASLLQLRLTALLVVMSLLDWYSSTNRQGDDKRRFLEKGQGALG